MSTSLYQSIFFLAWLWSFCLYFIALIFVNMQILKYIFDIAGSSVSIQNISIKKVILKSAANSEAWSHMQ